MAKSFDDLVKRTASRAIREKGLRRSRELMAELFLGEVRKLTGKSQRDLAKALGIRQPSVSKLENQDDMQISTLKRIVETLGGQLDIVAEFPNTSVRLKQFDAPRRARRRATGVA